MATAIYLHFRPHRHRQLILHNATSYLRPYSSSNSDNINNNNNKPQSHFSDVKSSLKNPTRPSDPTKKVASIEDIRNNLSKFSREPSVQPPSSAAKAISFQELYQRNLTPKPEPGLDLKTEQHSLRDIRESLKSITSNLSQSQSNANVNRSQRLSSSGFNLNLKLRPKGLNETDLDVKSSKSNESKAEFVRTFTENELGERLRKLRPGSKKVKFSLSELNERLQKVREMEEKQVSNSPFGMIRESLNKLNNNEEKKKAVPKTKVMMFEDTSRYLSLPPKEVLVEKYFHPDHMSSAEKQKLELKSVRDKFKISESDCGSARVQVAQLTTKIKHLATVLHKKDKHSRKGLQAMVQKRKKLLKYLRRTDWDSYCFCLSELGLRDSPDYKA
ncbi:uncharacterized protein LOC143536194 [Bidens hawaiensis]|uniref:uncharacterized protein LOC143536194 n=2 Tax=Bidens hawaiensis TaxID=980011 RepID=UPI00404B6ECD